MKRPASSEPSCGSVKRHRSMTEHNSRQGGISDSGLKDHRGEGPEPSCVSMKSSNSMFRPPNLSPGGTGIDPSLQISRAEGPELSYVSMKSSNSIFRPPDLSTGGTGIDPSLQISRAEGPEPSCVSMKSSNSIFRPPDLSTGGTGIDPSLQISRAEGPELSYVSMKSSNSIFRPPDLSTGGTGIDPSLQISRAEGPEPSSVSMKSSNSIFRPPDLSTGGTGIDPSLQISRAEGPEPSCVSMKSSNSIFRPPDLSTGGTGIDPSLQISRAEGPEPSCVSMKSSNSMFSPPDLSTGGTGIDPSLQISRAEGPELSCVSMKSSNSMFSPPDLSTGGTGIDPSLQISRAEGPEPSCVSMKSNNSMFSPPDLSTGGTGIDPSWRRNNRDDALQRIRERHKSSMKNKYECLFEGIKTQENQTLLNRIYTQLYIVEGESEGVNEEHEVLQMEKTFRKQSEDTPISYLDIFKPVEDPKGEMEEQNNRGVMANTAREKERKEDEEPKQLRTVLTKGVAGIGKTVSVQKFILDWAEGKANQDVDFMFVLPFRELNLNKDDQFSLHKLLSDFHPELKDLDPKKYDSYKVVFIFDGLDESRIPLSFSQCEKISDITMTSSVGMLMTNLIKGDLLPSAHIWITTRPAAASQIPPQYINRVTEIQGFNDPQKEEYFRKRISDEDQAKRIISHIKTARSLHIMCHIPVFCWISATVLQQMINQSKTEMPKTLTEMYTHFLLIQMNMKNEKYERNVKSDPVKLLESNRQMILKLAKLAFTQLMKGNVMFYEEDLRECGIDVTEASVYSGICTEIFKEESVLYQRKVYCIVHLSFQEFLAAVYVIYFYVKNNMEELWVFLQYDGSSDSLFKELLRGAVRKALESENGHLDLFLRFLLGISLESNQKLLQGLLMHTESSSESISETVQHIKQLIKTKDLPTERSINLFLCLTEVNDHSFSREIQEFLKSQKNTGTKLSAAHCSALAYMLQFSDEVLDELDTKKFNTSEEGYRRLVPAVSNCRKALLTGCNLEMSHCETICSALTSANSSLQELDLSNNNLQDSVELLSVGLTSSNCKLQILRLSGCSLGEAACENLKSALLSENSSLKELDLSNNDLQDSGVEQLCSGLKSSHCKLQILRLSLCKLGEEACKNLKSALLSENSSLKELDLSNNDLQDSGVEQLCAGLMSSHCKLQILRLSGCSLGEEACENLKSALLSENSSLKELDLSNNDLQDSGVEQLCAGLKSSHCKLQILRLSGCMITQVGCCSLASALSSNISHLNELDLTYNHPGEDSPGVKQLSSRRDDPQCALKTLRVEHGGENRIKPGPKKYACKLTLDPNTADTHLSLGEGNRVAHSADLYSPDWSKEEWLNRARPDHPDRFEQWEQVLSKETLSGRCYWEAEWRGPEAAVAVAYKTMRRKGYYGESKFGYSDKSWSLLFHEKHYVALHNAKTTTISTPPSRSKIMGVYVDCPAGVLSFYDVSDKPTHLHTFYTTFTEPLHAGFRAYGSTIRICNIE
ncbi:NACHT, LRR and PYD domains-containing protein 12-like isoform X3 [Pygocentrus nattereri]|uniref:NACHT, LRR and PYD domains-containing protein 12-like isoform X3 n=1 Tax=Pygocentrus nattereri TaxID=42514 RepID=UPI00189107D0|nr:NACHT, LRR and PYD domains-containing protein 12-like isoform X3 [Pygocentrus nattereri]